MSPRFVMRWRTCETPGCGRGFRSSKYTTCPDCRSVHNPRCKILAHRAQRQGRGAASKLRAQNRGHR